MSKLKNLKQENVQFKKLTVEQKNEIQKLNEKKVSQMKANVKSERKYIAEQRRIIGRKHKMESDEHKEDIDVLISDPPVKKRRIDDIPKLESTSVGMGTGGSNNSLRFPSLFSSNVSSALESKESQIVERDESETEDEEVNNDDESEVSGSESVSVSVEDEYEEEDNFEDEENDEEEIENEFLNRSVHVDLVSDSEDGD